MEELLIHCVFFTKSKNPGVFRSQDSPHVLCLFETHTHRHTPWQKTHQLAAFILPPLPSHVHPEVLVRISPPRPAGGKCHFGSITRALRCLEMINTNSFFHPVRRGGWKQPVSRASGPEQPPQAPGYRRLGGRRRGLSGGRGALATVPSDFLPWLI